MVGLRSSQFRATCGTLLPVSAESASSASTTLYKYSSGTCGPRSAVLCRRLLLRQGLPAADLSGEPSPTQRAPHQGAHTFGKRQRHQLPLVVAAYQRVVDLVGRIARPPILPADSKGLLQGASPRNSRLQCNAACPGAPRCPTWKASPQWASARRSRACDTRRCSRSAAASSFRRSGGSGAPSTNQRCSGPSPN